MVALRFRWLHLEVVEGIQTFTVCTLSEGAISQPRAASEKVSHRSPYQGHSDPEAETVVQMVEAQPDGSCG